MSIPALDQQSRDPGEVQRFITSHLRAHADAITKLHERALHEIERAALLMTRALERGGKLLLFGNGGSAAQAQHLAAELTVGFRRIRPGLPAVALSSDPVATTAIANDFGYSDVFARQCEALGQSADMAMGLTTSGRSENVLRALERARCMGMCTVALTGAAGLARDVAEVVLAAPSRDPAIVQEIHLVQIHVLCRLVEEAQRKRAPVLFLDRDGTLMRDTGYISDPEKLELLPGVATGLLRFQKAGYRLVVVTNQSGVARGLIRMSDVERVNARLTAELEALGIWLDAILVCPHGPDDGCLCRKPETALLEQWLGGRAIDRDRSWLVGDKVADIEAGRRLGLRTAAVPGAEPCGGADLQVVGLDALFEQVVGASGQ